MLKRYFTKWQATIITQSKSNYSRFSFHKILIIGTDTSHIKTLFHLAKEKRVECKIGPKSPKGPKGPKSPKGPKGPKSPLVQNNKYIEKSPYLRNNDIKWTNGLLDLLDLSALSSTSIPTAYTFSDKLKMEDQSTSLVFISNLRCNANVVKPPYLCIVKYILMPRQHYHYVS